MDARKLVVLAIAALLTAAPGCVRSSKNVGKLGANPAAARPAGGVSSQGQIQNGPVARVISTNGAAIKGVVRGPAAGVVSNHAAGIVGTNGASLAGQASTLLANNAASLVGNNAAGLVASNTARYARHRRLASLAPRKLEASALVPIAGALVDLYDLAGNRVSTTSVRTAPDGSFSFPAGSLGPSSGPLVARARVQLAGRELTIEALLPAGADTAAGRTLALDPASSLVAKKARAIGADGRLATANLAEDAAQALADALAPFLSERGAVAAVLIDAIAASQVLDGLEGASPALAGKLSEAAGGSGGTPLLGDPAPGGPAPLAPGGSAPEPGSAPGPAGPAPGAPAGPAAPAAPATGGGRRGGGGSGGGGSSATPTPAPTPTPTPTPADASYSLALDEPFYVERVAGTGVHGSDNATSALTASFADLAGVTGASDGTLYVTDADHHQVRRLRPGRAPELLAGQADEGSGFSGDGQAASQARLHYPLGIHYDERFDYLVVADHENNRLRGFAPDGRIETVAGGGNDDSDIVISPLSAQLDGPAGVAVDEDGWLFFTEHGRARFRGPGGQLRTLGPIGEGFGHYPIASDPGRDLAWYADGDQLRVVTDVRGVPALAPEPAFVVPANGDLTMRIAALATDQRGRLFILVRAETDGGFPRGVQLLRLATGSDGMALAGAEPEVIMGTGGLGDDDADYLVSENPDDAPLDRLLPAFDLSGLWIDLHAAADAGTPAGALYLGLAAPSHDGPAGQLLKLMPGEVPQ